MSSFATVLPSDPPSFNLSAEPIDLRYIKPTILHGQSRGAYRWAYVR